MSRVQFSAARARGAPFNPLTGSPSLLLDERGQSAGSWLDQSGNGHDFAQASGPLQPATGTRTINGLAAQDFDGSNDFLVGPTLGSLVSLTAYHGFVVFSPDAITGYSLGSEFVGPSLIGDTGDYFWAALGNHSGVYEASAGHWDGAAQSATLSPVGLSAAHILEFSYDGTMIRNRLDAGSTVTRAAGNIQSGSQLVRLGNYNSSFGFFLDGLEGQVVLFPNYLSAPDQAGWRTYLGGKWGVSV